MAPLRWTLVHYDHNICPHTRAQGLHTVTPVTTSVRNVIIIGSGPAGYTAAICVNQLRTHGTTEGHILVTGAAGGMGEHIATKDLRMVDHEVLMPASQPLFGQAHVTTSSYDIPTDRRTERRKALQSAVEVGAGEGATQRDRGVRVELVNAPAAAFRRET